jgi:hypothetical protein
MTMHDATQRRQLVRMLLAGGALGASGLSGFMSRALAAGDLPGGTGLVRLEGSATINGRPARIGAEIAMGDRLATGANTQAVVVLKGDALLLRSRTIVEIRGRENTLAELVITAGRVLSVFARKPVTVKASSATVGIRGTGAYFEVDPGSIYFCLCYGEAVVDGPGMPPRTVKTTHHESPLILREEGGAMSAQPGPFLNHTDDELILLESLVGREPPFLKDGQYPAIRY